MRTISCFIIDDDSSTDLLSEFIQTTSSLELSGTASSYPDAFNCFLRMSPPHVLFVNIDLSKDFDLNLYNYIIKHDILVIITSAFKDNAFLAFELGFIDYLLKPLSYERFLKTISRVFNISKSLIEKNWLYIQSETKGRIIKIVFDEVKYIEACQNYLIIVLNNNQHITYQTMKLIEQKLPSQSFIRVHKSFIVNEARIHSINYDCVVLNDKTIIKIGPNYRERLLSRLLICLYLPLVLFVCLNNIATLILS